MSEWEEMLYRGLGSKESWSYSPSLWHKKSHVPEYNVIVKYSKQISKVSDERCAPYLTTTAFTLTASSCERRRVTDPNFYLIILQKAV